MRETYAFADFSGRSPHALSLVEEVSSRFSTSHIVETPIVVSHERRVAAIAKRAIKIEPVLDEHAIIIPNCEWIDWRYTTVQRPQNGSKWDATIIGQVSVPYFTITDLMNMRDSEVHRAGFPDQQAMGEYLMAMHRVDQKAIISAILTLYHIAGVRTLPVESATPQMQRQQQREF